MWALRFPDGAFVLCLLIRLCGHGASAQSLQLKTIYNSSWEDRSALLWPALVKDWDCPCPVASFNLQSTAAARTGRFGVRISVNTPAPEAWHVQLQTPLFNLSSSQLYTACFWVRTDIPGGAGIEMTMVALDGYQWVDGNYITAIADWMPVCTAGVELPSGANGAATNASYYFVLNVGHLTGTIYVDDFTLGSQRNTAAQDEVYCNPTNTAARIDANRKGSLSIKFVNKTTNQTLNGARLNSLRLRLETHDFPFGTAMEWRSVSEDWWGWYNSTARKHFNALVTEWSFNWPFFEPEKGAFSSNRDYLMRNHIDFAFSNGFVQARAVSVEWLSKAKSYSQHWSRQGSCSQYRTNLLERISRDVAVFRGLFKVYDVFDEILRSRDVIDRCPGLWPGIVYDAFRTAHDADPTAQLCLTDYNLVDGNMWRQMMLLAADMKAAGVPFHCIAVQAFINPAKVSPAFMKLRLDALASLNVSIYINAYNFISASNATGAYFADTEAEHARLHEEFVSFWFSLPYIKGIYLWGFWEAVSWIENGGIYRVDGTPKASAEKLLTMWGSTWNTTVRTNSFVLSRTGIYGPIRAFYGKYWMQARIGSNNVTALLNFSAARGRSQTITIRI